MFLKEDGGLFWFSVAYRDELCASSPKIVESEILLESEGNNQKRLINRL